MKFLGKLNNYGGLISIFALLAIIFVAYKLGIFEKTETSTES